MERSQGLALASRRPTDGTKLVAVLVAVSLIGCGSNNTTPGGSSSSKGTGGKGTGGSSAGKGTGGNAASTAGKGGAGTSGTNGGNAGAASGGTGGSGNSAGGSGGAAGAGGASGAPAGVTGSGTALGYDGNLAMAKPIEGVAVCVLDHSEIPCVMTDGAGQFALPGIPPGADVAISFTKTGYYGEVEVTHSPTTDFHLGAFGSGPNEMFTDAYAAQFFQSAGWTYPSADKGVLFSKVAPVGLMNACMGVDKATLTASTGGTPVYGIACTVGGDHNGPGTADPTLTTTSAIGEGFFLVAPGPIDLTAMHPTLKCNSVPIAQAPDPGAGWASAKPSTVSATVRAGYLTKVVQQCN
jgi:hypothetical protein